MNYDVIGDIHGNAQALHGLLEAMGYSCRGGVWRAPEGRQAVFVGDLIDRGPQQLAVLRTVRDMVEADQALLVLGNHELNAIALVDRDPATGACYRPRTDRNLSQHKAFLDEVGLDSQEHHEWVNWFRKMPLALDLNGIRVVHGWWDEGSIQTIAELRPMTLAREHEPLEGALMQTLYDTASPACKARKRITCGIEWDLPDGQTIEGVGGAEHGEIRVAVWRHWAKALKEVALVPHGPGFLPDDMPVPEGTPLVEVSGSPILFGHHWFSGPVKLESPKVACLDWSAANGGQLVAYRWDGEEELSDSKLVAVAA